MINLLYFQSLLEELAIADLRIDTLMIPPPVSELLVTS